MMAKDETMLDLYTAPAPNGRRATIIMEECGLPYRLHNLDFAKREQKAPEFLARNPLGNVPVLVDPQGPGGAPITLTQSGAIAIYMADKTGRFLPAEGLPRLRVLEKLMFVMSDVAAASTSMFVTVRNDPQSPLFALFEGRMRDLLAVASKELETRDYLVDDLSIADLALYPMMLLPHMQRLMPTMPDLSGLTQWSARMAARPGVQRALAASPLHH